MIAVTTYATKGYLFAWLQMVRRVATAVAHHGEGHFIFATDKSKEAKEAGKIAERELPEGWTVHVIEHDIADDSSENYKLQAQLRIATLQGSAFAMARKLRSSACWSVESDVLVPPDALKLSEWVLSMPGSYYDIAMVTYPNAAFLGGRGVGINPDFHPEERMLPERLSKRWEAHKAWADKRSKAGKPIPDRWHRINGLMHKKIQECPPMGNVWKVNAEHGWKPRGWFEQAYPGIGRGAILPTDWVGLGCTLLSGRALALAAFEGYSGQGTQDIFLGVHRWCGGGLKMAVIPHVVCDHVKPERDAEGNRTGRVIHMQAFHESNGQCEGHLRTRHTDWTAL